MTIGRIELHTHLEGSVTPARLVALAARHGVPNLPATCLNQHGDAYVFDGFTGFLELYKRVTSVMRTPRDFHTLALDLGQQLHQDGVVYAEVSVSYAVLLMREIDPLPVQKALYEAAEQIETEWGVRMRWIPDAVRQFAEKSAWQAWEKAATAGRHLGVVGFGLGGDEARGPAARYTRLFAEVKSEGFGVSIHAGENPGLGPAAADSVRAAVEECGADRIGHGLAAAVEPSVLELLAAREVFLELCPGSNVATGGVSGWPAYPLPVFLAAGIPCALNTDDRTLFGLDLRTEYERAAEQFSLAPDSEATMQAAAAKAVFGDLL